MRNKDCLLIIFFCAALSGCLPENPVVHIYAAENIRKTPEGRIFVTGRDNLFELVQNEQGEYAATPLTQDLNCHHFAGLAQLHDWLFFVCARQTGLSLKTWKFTDAGTLYAYSLQNADVHAIMDLTGYQFANGLDALVSEDAILVADEDFISGNGGVSKARIDFNGPQPTLLEYQPQWIGPAQGVFAANGIRVKDDAVYLTDIGRFLQIPLDQNGEPEAAIPLFSTATVLDDFDRLCDGFLVADWVGGKLIYVPDDNSGAKIIPAGLNTPSALLADATPLFPANEILLTESTGLKPGTANQVIQLKRDVLNIEQCK